MFIDHIHQMFVPMGAPDWLDWFGRPVATLFFLSASSDSVIPTVKRTIC